jgi:pimeloyl-ACP methyl ester carboxylesterase
MLAGPGIPIDELMKIQVIKVQEAEGVSTSENQKSNELTGEIYKILKTVKDDKDARTQLIALFDKYMEESGQKMDEFQLEQSINTYLSPWFRYFIAFEPKLYLEKVKCPVLALNGEKDVQVTAKENLDAIESKLKQSGNTALEIHSLPNLNHLFQNSKTGAVSEYAVLEETISEEVLELVKAFILK